MYEVECTLGERDVWYMHRETYRRACARRVVEKNCMYAHKLKFVHVYTRAYENKSICIRNKHAIINQELKISSCKKPYKYAYIIAETLENLKLNTICLNTEVL